MYSFDLRLTLIPFSLLRITNTFTLMRSGEEMEIISGAGEVDAATMEDIKRILPRSSYDIIASESLHDNGPTIRLRLRKKKISTTHTQKESDHV